MSRQFGRNHFKLHAIWACTRFTSEDFLSSLIKQFSSWRAKFRVSFGIFIARNTSRDIYFIKKKKKSWKFIYRIRFKIHSNLSSLLVGAHICYVTLLLLQHRREFLDILACQQRLGALHHFRCHVVAQLSEKLWWNL